jgi:prepilin-type N-terminal cleavage/methylation domain-containing protein
MRRTDCRGMTLLEVVLAMAVNAILITIVVKSLLDFERTRRVRELVSSAQGTARAALSLIEDDLRAASLGTHTGVIWSVAATGRVQRPSVQIFDGIPAGSAAALALDPKPGTDAVLVVRAERGEWAKTTRDHFEATSLAVTQNPAAGRQIVAGQAVLLGDFGDAGWDVVERLEDGGATMVLRSAVDVFPGLQNRKLPATSSIRPARARLYYVSARDELVRVELATPRPPTVAADVVARSVLATGVENLQIDCQLDDAGALGACPPALDPVQEASVESANAFGAFETGSGPRLQSGDVPSLRMVAVSVVVRAAQPVAEASQGDAPIAIEGVTLGASAPDGSASTRSFVRRAYRIGVAVRNTSLGVL